MKRLFCGWVVVLDALRRRRILEDSAHIMRQNTLVERTMRALKERADKKIKERLIVERFQERAEMA